MYKEKFKVPENTGFYHRGFLEGTNNKVIAKAFRKYSQGFT